MIMKITREQVRQAAAEKVRYYNAVIEMEQKPTIRRGKKYPAEAGVPAREGWWVDCKIFVGKDDFNDGE